nr:uncharacterized protein LOC117162604 [Bombus vancouverensis nearcticus]
MDNPVWLVFIYKLGISSVLLVQKIGLRLPMFRGIIYFVMDTSVNTQILIFVCILFLIEERFRHLCNMVPFSKGKRRGSGVFPIAESSYCSYCWHYKCRSSSFTFDILRSDDLFQQPYSKCAANVSTILLSPAKEAREA